MDTQKFLGSLKYGPEQQQRALEILKRALMGRQYLARQEWVIPLDNSVQISWMEGETNWIVDLYSGSLTPFTV